MSTLLRVEKLEKAFGTSGHSLTHTIALKLVEGISGESRRLVVLKDLDLAVSRGECVAVHGGNGSGKSTLLRCIAGIVTPSGGKIVHEGKTLAHLAHGFGAYEELPVWRNIQLVLQLFGLRAAEAKAKLKDVAAFAGLSERLLSPCSHLSEGMRAKMPLAALTAAPFDLVLLDESLNHVDADFRDRFHVLTRNWIAAGRSLMLTSHDSSVLDRYGTRHLRIQDGKLVTR